MALTPVMSNGAESLLVMRNLGVQVGTRYYSGRERKVFIERQRIESVIINEGIQTWAIFYYMAILVKGQERMVLPFEVPFNPSPPLRARSRTHLPRALAIVGPLTTLWWCMACVKHVFPRLHVILPVYKATRALLFGEPSEDEDEGNHQQQH